MNGWTRIWMVISLLASGGVFAFTMHAWYVDIPARGMYWSEIAEQFDSTACKSLRPAVQQLRDEGEMWSLMGEKPECAGLIRFGYQNKYSWDWIRSAQDYARHESNQQERYDRYMRWSWFLPLPGTVTFLGLWVVFFAVRPVVRWISRGFRTKPTSIGSARGPAA